MLLRKSPEAEARTLTFVGLALVLCAVVATLGVAIDPFDGRPRDRISVAIDTPYVGQGVDTGTAVIMHGVKVGEVTRVSSRPGGGVQLDAALRAGPAAALTDTLSIDFRPANYFGVTGVNVIPSTGGRVLQDGMRIKTTPRGNFTLQALLSRLGEITGGAVTPQLVSVIDKATRYVDGLSPLMETMLIVADAVTRVQSVSTEQLLTNTTGVSVAFPSFVDALTEVGDRVNHSGVETLSEDFFQNNFKPSIDLASKSLFASVGRLESTHVDELTPAVEMVKTFTDAVPALIRPADFAQTLVEVRTRLEKLYAGSGDQRAIQVHIVLDSLPGVAAPLGVMGVPQ